MPEPSLTPFISRQDLSDYIGQDVTADAGALAAVDAACDMVRNVAEQAFNAGTTTVVLDGTGTDALLLPETPVNNVGTVSIRGTTVDPQFYAVRDDGAVLRTYGTATGGSQPLFSDDWQFVSGYSQVCWPVGRQNISVTYSHGYEPDDLPRDVRMVALTIASRLIIQGVTNTESVGDVTVRYGTNATDFTKGEKDILRKYKPAR